jgi:hypothetical protein
VLDSLDGFLYLGRGFVERVVVFGGFLWGVFAERSLIFLHRYKKVNSSFHRGVIIKY